MKKEIISQKKSILFLIPFLIILGNTLLFSSFFTPDDKVKKNPDLNVLLITIDTIRADRVGYSGYDIETPNLDLLAYEGARFMNAVCQVPLTLPSHASIFTGTNPNYHQLKGNGPYYLGENFTTLAEIMKAKGFSTSAFVGSYILDSEYGLNQGFDFYDDDFVTPDYSVKERLAEDVYNSAAEWLEKNHEKKFFVWVHYFDPHDPYTPPPPFDINYKSRPYEGEIAYTDIYVGKLINLLKEREIYNKTLVIIVGDHGEDLFDHMEPTHGIFLYDTALKVPLIFHSPGAIPGGKKIDNQVRTIDIFPTILDILKIDIPEYCQGASLIPLMRDKKIKAIEESYAETYYPSISYGWSALKSIRTNKWKYIQAPKSELYNLENDPEEKNNLFKENKKIAVGLRDRLKKLEKRISSGLKPSIRELTPEDQEKLRALGYVSGRLPSDIKEKERPDPKDKILLLEHISKGKQALKGGRLDEGEKILIEIMKQDPENAMIHHSLGEIYQKKGEWDKAIKEFQEIIKINPADIDTYYMLAKSYYGKGMIEEAIKTSEAALNMNPKHLKSLLFLASLYKSLNEIDQSLNYLEKAVNVVPSKLEMRLEYAQKLTFAKKHEKAIKEYEYILNKMPDNPMPYNNLGIIYYYKKDFEKAIRYLSKELELHSNPSSYFLLGLASGELQRYVEAVKYLEKYLTSAPAKDISLRKKAEQALAFFKSKIK
ncbi:MAG: sulfatase-like hydrolase/transferase [Candidatus Aminicenantes bacterium]|nr:MAG: sulfatase-like hydrolase/transferase [Candidatus Aminicenantes bacterium]